MIGDIEIQDCVREAVRMMRSVSDKVGGEWKRAEKVGKVIGGIERQEM